MVETYKNSGEDNKDSSAAGQKTVLEFVERLSDEQKMLIVLKSQLYDGSWAPMLDDLRNRLVGKPYIFKLSNRIQEDIRRIEQISQFETDHSVDLADYVPTS